MPRNIYAEKGRIQRKQLEGPKGPTKFEREQALRDTTLDHLGTPDDLEKIDVKETHDMNHYRINVYRRIKGYIKMTDSHYISIVEGGVISSPQMTKKYYDADLEKISHPLED